MLEGLEVSEIRKSSISFENDFFRIDSQYFKKEYLKEDSNRKKYKNTYLGQIAFITDGQHGYHEVDDNSPIRHLTAKNAKGWFANDIDADRIAKWVDDNNRRSSLEKDDLILSTRGTVGLCAIVDSDVLPSNIDQDVARIKFENKKLLPTVALTYLNCKVGQDWLERNQTGMVQQGIALWRVREIPLPIFTDKFQEIIDGIIKDSKNHKNNSKEAYFNAEALLLETLGLKDFELSTDLVNVKGFKDSFLATGRLDAQYYQKKYEEIERIISEKGVYRIKDVFDLLSNPSPSSYTESGIKVIKTKNVRIPSLEIENITDHTTEKCLLVQQNDLLFASMGVGSLGRLSYCESDIINCTVDGTIKVFRCRKEFQDKYLEIPTLLFLTSSFGQELIYKYVIGSTGIISISKENIENLLVPIIDKSVAETLTSMVLESQQLKKQSEQLLETAKRAVEIAIEQDEEAAMRYIEQARMASM